MSATAVAGGARIRTWLEGSNDNVNWHAIVASAEDQVIDTTAQVRALGEDMASVVDLSRWSRIRVRAEDLAAGTFTIVVTLSGVRLPGQAYANIETALTRTAATVNGTTFSRQGGARYASVTVGCTAIVNGGQTVLGRLQGSPDGGTTWITIATSATFDAAGSVILLQDGSDIIDLGGFDTLRFQLFDTGVTSYTCATYLSTDSMDHLLSADAGGPNVADILSDALVNITQDAATVEALDQRNVTLRVETLTGSPLLAERLYKIILSDSINAGDNDLATNAVFGAIIGGDGTLISGGGTNEAIVRSSATGTVTIGIIDAATETVYLMAVEGGVPKAARMLIIECEQQAIAFA